MVKAVKVLVNSQTYDIEYSAYTGYIYPFEKDHTVKTYPLIEDRESLMKIIAQDIEHIFLSKYDKFIKVYEKSKEYKNLFNFISLLNENSMPDISPESLIKIDMPSTTYYLRRYLKEQAQLRDKKDIKDIGFVVRLTVQDTIDILNNIPPEFKLLNKEASELQTILKRYSNFREYTYFRFSGDMLYTKQYIANYFIEEQHEIASMYFKVVFISNNSLTNLKGPHVYKPFLEKINNILEDSIDDSAPSLYRELFGKRLTETNLKSSYDNLYIHQNDRVLMLPLEEERYFYNLDSNKYNNLPNKFLLDGKIVIKENSNKDIKVFKSPILLDESIHTLGETMVKLESSTEGFVLSSKNLFSVDLDYIEDTLISSFKELQTMPTLSKESSSDKVLDNLHKMYPIIVQDEKLKALMKAIVENNMDPKMYDYLVRGVVAEYGNNKTELLMDLVRSKLYGKPTY